MDFKKLINSNIRKLRIELGLTQEEFAEKIGKSSRAISKIECNYVMPSAATINKICEVFDILPDVLCRYDTNPASKVDALRLINSELNRLNIQQLKQILDIAKTFPK